MQTRPVTVVETPIFLRQADAIWDDGERAVFVDFIARHPEAGDVIPGTGGVRKIRWSRPGMGKRGGARVLYFYYNIDAPLYLLLAYAKSVRTDMTAEERRAVAALVEIIKQHHARERKP